MSIVSFLLGIEVSGAHHLTNRLERLPLVTLLETDDSDIETWSLHGDPILGSLLSDPENQVHLRW